MLACCLPAGGEELTDDILAESLRAGADWLAAQVGEGGTVPSRCFRTLDGGAEAMGALALLEAGRTPEDPAVARLAGYLADHSPQRTTARALRVELFARLGREQELASATKELLAGVGADGGWSTGPGDRRSNVLDTSAALLGLSAAGGAGVAVPPEVFRAGLRFLETCRNDDGGMGYLPRQAPLPRLRGPSHGTATAATARAQGAVLLVGVGRWDDSELRAYRKSLGWLSDHDGLERVPGWWWGAEPVWAWRADLAAAPELSSPYALGGVDFASRLARAILQRQADDGRWVGQRPAEDDVIATARAVRTLAGLARPVLLNCLAAGPGGPETVLPGRLCRWASRQLGREVTFRAVGPDVTEETLRAAPLLLVTGHARRGGSVPAGLGERLAGYVRAGGWVIVAPSDEGGALGRRAEAMFVRSQPGGKARAVRPDDPLFLLGGRIEGLSLREIALAGSGRVLLVGEALSAAWQAGPNERLAGAQALWGNVQKLALGDRALPGRFSPPVPVHAGETLLLGRVFHGGDWQAWPGAAEAVSADLRRAISTGVRETTVYLNRPIPAEVAMLWLVAPDELGLDGTDLGRLLGSLRPGRVLLVDAGAGQPGASKEVLRRLREAWGGERLEPIPADDPLLSGRFGGGLGSDARTVRLRTADGRVRVASPRLLGLRRDGQWVAVVSPLLLAGGCAGEAPAGRVAYESADARRLVLNCLLYAASVRAEQQAGP